MTKNDLAWVKLFDEYDILSNIGEKGTFRISALTINKVREARLMTKFDHRVNLPKIFRDNNLSILPDSRGTYIIGNFNTYQTLIRSSNPIVKDVEFPRFLHTIDPANLYSEAASLLCAFNAGIIDDLAEEKTHFTLAGRMSTGRFNYTVKTNSDQQTISVMNAQCEIDGGFETKSQILLIEAKNYQSSDFHIRQLFYPYRLLLAKAILSNPIFAKALAFYFETSRLPVEDQIREIMLSENLDLNDTTIRRRAQTVLRWIEWIVKLEHL